jgi:hypothetical protein
MAIVTGGALSFGLFAGHTAFHRLFGWGPELARLSERNRRILYTIHVALYLLFLHFAFVSLAYPGELTRPGLGGALAAAYAVFWVWRLVWQVVYFGPLVRGERARWRWLHRGLVAVFALMVVAYGVPAAGAWLAASG